MNPEALFAYLIVSADDEDLYVAISEPNEDDEPDVYIQAPLSEWLYDKKDKMQDDARQEVLMDFMSDHMAADFYVDFDGNGSERVATYFRKWYRKRYSG